MSTEEEKNREKLKQQFEETLSNKVLLTLVSNGKDDQETQMTRTFIADLAELTDKVEFAERTDAKDDTTVIEVGRNLGYNISFWGAPTGMETQTFLQSLVMASRGDETLPGGMKEKFDSLPKDTLVEVFVSPNCPHCPRQALLAVASAIAAPGKIEGRVTMTGTNLDRAKGFGVSAVPTTILDEKRKRLRQEQCPCQRSLTM